MKPFQAGDYWTFCEGLAAVRQNDKWGYIDHEGHFAITPQFSDAAGFSEGLAVIEVKKKYGYIDKTGSIVIAPRYDFANPFTEGVAVVYLNSRHLIIDKQGNTLIKLDDSFTDVESFSDGLAPAEINLEKYGYINHAGEVVVIPPQYDYVTPFTDGLAIVNIGDKYGYIDTTGNQVMPPQFDDAEYFSEEVAPVRKDGVWRFVNRNGETQTLLGDRFDYVYCLTEGRAVVQVGDKYGAIDKSGNLLIEARFDQLNFFTEGLAYARIGNTHGFINPSGSFEIQKPVPQRTLLDRLLGRNKPLQW